MINLINLLTRIKDARNPNTLYIPCFLPQAQHKLKSDGLVDIETEHLGKRVRHYYRLTEMKIEVYLKKKTELLDFINTINKVITS